VARVDPPIRKNIARGNHSEVCQTSPVDGMRPLMMSFPPEQSSEPEEAPGVPRSDLR
jgi:hypothetical protein